MSTKPEIPKSLHDNALQIAEGLAEYWDVPLREGRDKERIVDILHTALKAAYCMGAADVSEAASADFDNLSRKIQTHLVG